ncbi:MAG: FAD-dependent oxidoreductase [Gammaproteobacteria bacterium]
MKIAVVGAGVSGLVCALGLGREHDVVVFEGARRSGGHAHTVVVNEQSRSLAIDVGFIVFNFAHYPHLSSLFDRLGVVSQPSDMSFSVRCDRTQFEFSGSNLNTFFAQRQNLLRMDAWRLLFSILRFNRIGQRTLQGPMSDQISVDEFTRQMGFDDVLVDRYLLPLGGALWSCSTETFRQFPMKFFLEFLQNHQMLQLGDRPVWRTVVGGSQEYVQRLTALLGSRIRLGEAVKEVSRAADGVYVRLENGSVERFDEVVLATHADTSLSLVSGADDEEQEMLGAFPYQDNSVCLHTDSRVLPESRRAWASWNYRVRNTSSTHTCVTYNMNKLQALDSTQTYCVSLNQDNDIDPDKIVHSQVVRHPLFTPGRDAVQANHARLIRRGGLSYCGAYWGFGFHEDGVRSALAVCDAFGVERPC